MPRPPLVQLANMVRRFFMFRNKSLLEDQPFWKPLLEAKDLKEFISHMHNVTGHKSEEEYYDEHSADLQVFGTALCSARPVRTLSARRGLDRRAGAPAATVARALVCGPGMVASA